jgi:hypothetical protein
MWLTFRLVLVVAGALHAANGPFARPKRWAADRFLWRVFIVDLLAWMTLGYSAGASIEYVANREDFHVWPSQVAWAGLGVTIGTLVPLIGIIAIRMRGSSAVHRSRLFMSLSILVLALPITAMHAVSDSNRTLDHAAPMTIVRTVEHCEAREHPGRKSRDRPDHTYHVWLAPMPEHPTGPSLPIEVIVTREICDELLPGDDLEFAISPGRWGIPWYRWMRAGNETWTAPH